MGGAWGPGIYLTTSKEEALSWIGAIRREGSGRYLYTCRIHGRLLSGLLNSHDLEKFRPYLSEGLMNFYLKTINEDHGLPAVLLYDRLRNNHPGRYTEICLNLGFIGVEHTTQRDQFGGVNAVIFDPSKIEIIHTEAVDNKKLSITDVLSIFSENKNVLSQASLQRHIKQAQKLGATGIQDLVRDRSESEIVRMDWDQVVFGVSEGERVMVKLQDITPDPRDLENATGIDLRKYFKNTDPAALPPLDIVIEYGELHLVDGHHRWTYALKLGVRELPAIVSIRDNPLQYLGVNMDQIVAMSRVMN